MLVTVVTPQVLSFSLAGVASAGIIIMVLVHYLTDSKVKPALSRLSHNISVFIIPFLILIFYIMVFSIVRIVTS